MTGSFFRKWLIRCWRLYSRVSLSMRRQEACRGSVGSDSVTLTDHPDSDFFDDKVRSVPSANFRLCFIHAAEGRFLDWVFFSLDYNLAPAHLAISEYARTGLGPRGWLQANAQPPLSSLESGANMAADCTQPLPLKPPRSNYILHKPSQQNSNHMPQRLSSFLDSVSGHIESSSSSCFLTTLKNTLQETSACSSHLHVQPGLHIHG